mmetsp:Transcript_8946/g.29560  ORF Transcript_8946/g.29560 Transcript_8946/m.29560 type:complete len:296 (-) Transcript_8946:51-938(-)
MAESLKRKTPSARTTSTATSLHVVHRCAAYVAIDKPADLRIDSGRAGVHAGEPNAMDLLRKIVGPDLANEIRPCHQLDYATSGVMLYALTKPGAAAASDMFAQRKAKKRYLALVWGTLAPPEDGCEMRCDEPVCADPDDDFKMMCGDKDVVWPLEAADGALPEGDDALAAALAMKKRRDDLKKKRNHSGTASTVIKVLGAATYRGLPATKVELHPQTGRRHQLRVHCTRLGHCIVGDATYSDDTASPRMMLHAHTLDLPFQPNKKAAKLGTMQEALSIQTPDPFVPENLPHLVLL